MAPTPIPGPPGLPLVGNVADIDANDSLGSFKSLAEKYGNVYQISILGQRLIIVSTHALVDEVCDEKRFKKVASNVLVEIRNAVHDGLFTANLEELNWGVAHRVLMPAFGPLSIRSMFDEMHDIASQLVLKWARQGPHKKIMLTDDFTRLTLDTIALCSMGFRFNSFYTEQMHPFVRAMADFLTECGRRTQRPPLPSFFFWNDDSRYQCNIDIMRETAEMILKERVADRENRREDLLTAMLKERDPRTGQKMNDSSIIDNLITFLIAGHETTSGLLSYAMHNLLKHPEAYNKVQREVDEVIGAGPVTVQHMQRLPYIAAVLRETLRLDSPISAFSVQPIEDTTLAGKYPVHKGETIVNLISNSHLDPEVFESPFDFRPERMLGSNFDKLPKNAWKPFGNGARACIGRPFAWQEAVLAMAMIFQNFNLVLDNPQYRLEHKQTLTIKPKNLFVRAKLRDGLSPTELVRRLVRTGVETTAAKPVPDAVDARSREPDDDEGGIRLSKMTILYGSNSGTCELMGRRLASDACAHGYKVVKLDCMDSAIENIPRDDPTHPVVFITASYEGRPPDNAAKFVSWIENVRNDEPALRGLRYAVFGCGHRDWSRSFHRIPRLIDRRLEEAGCMRVAELGLSDVAEDNMFTDFETWEDSALWPALDATQTDVKGPLSLCRKLPVPPLKVHVSSRTETLKQGLTEARVILTRTLTADGEPVKKHLEIQLPPGLTYRAGDYLTVLPSNPKASVLRAMREFELPWDAVIILEGPSTTLPTDVAMYARTILSDFVEMGQPATKKGIIELAGAAEVEDEARALMDLSRDDSYYANISAKWVSVLDLLERYPSVKLGLGTFLALLPPMRSRQYSISSSPLANASIATLTFSILAERAKSGNGTYLGVASTYLAGLQPGDPVYISVRPSVANFHLPEDAEATPLILVAAGSGIAPFRGFIQERGALISTLPGQRPLSPAVLYYGCREAGRDDLYTNELSKWEGMGAITVRRAYSRAPNQKEELGWYKYVHDALWADREELHELWKEGARVYVCGSRALSQGVDRVAARMKMEAAEQKGEKIGEAEAQEWWDALRNVRYVSDVFD